MSRFVLRLLYVVIVVVSIGYFTPSSASAAGTTLVTNGSVSIKELPSVLQNTSLRIFTGVLNSATTSSIVANFVGSPSATLAVATGWTQVQNGSTDDSFRQVNFGFNMYFNTATYSGAFIGSNTYITFGSGSGNYSGLSASNPAIPGVHMCAADNSYQKVFYKYDDANTFRVRYEGNNSTSGTVGSPSMVYEAIFYREQNYFDIHFGLNSRCASDTVAPTVTSVTSSKANGSYKVGDVIDIDVNFSERVTSTGNVTVTLETGSVDRTCTFAISNGTFGTCDYTVQEGDTSSDLTVQSIAGTIKDAAGNSMTSYTPATNLAANKALVIDTTAPTVSNVTSGTTNGSYRSGQLIPIQVVFSETVTVTGTPQLVLTTTNPATTTLNYTSGSGSNTLVFNYTVASTNSSSDLDYSSTGSLSPNSGVIKDTAGNNATLTLASPGGSGSLGANKALVIDNTAPSVTLTSTANNQTSTSPIPITITFSESVTNFILSDITISNGVGGSFSGTGASYSLKVTPSSSGNVTVSVSSGVAADTAGNTNTASSTLTRSYDGTPPTVTLATAISSPTLTTPIPFTATFSETISNFSISDIVVTNATVGNFQTVGSTAYTFDVSPIGHPVNNVDVTVSVPANSATDSHGNQNTASNSNTPYAIRFDNHSPTVSIVTSAGETTNNTSIGVTVTFSESVTGFASGDLSLTNATVSGFSGSGTTYYFTLVPTASGAYSVSVPASVAQDAATNQNLVSNTLTRTYDATPPTVTLSTSTSSPTSSNSFSVTATFSETVTGFTIDDLSITSGTASNFLGSNTAYTFDVTRTNQGTVAVVVPQGSGTDSSTNGNSVSNTLSIVHDSAGPTLSETTPVGSTTDTTPNYTFSSNEAGTITYSGDCSSSTSSASSGSNTVTFNTLSEGVHNNCAIVVTDSLGNNSQPLVVTSFTISASAGPVISNISAVPTSNSATVTWSTDKTSTSQIFYGFVSTYGFVTTQADIDPKVVSHSVSLSSLKSCARYFYKVRSVDISGNITDSTTQNFNTSGCPTSTIDTGSESSVQTAVGGTVRVQNENHVALLTIPANFYNENASFQLNRLSASSAPTPPTGTSLVQNNFYDLLAVDNNDSQISTFEERIDFSVNYDSVTESSYLENTLDVYRYTNGSWVDQNCTLNTSTNSLTCNLTSFSVYGVFGAPIASTAVTSSSSSSSSTSTSTSNNASAPSCTDKPPLKTPNLLIVDRQGSVAKVSFSTASDATGYQIFYGTDTSASQHATQFDYNGPLWYYTYEVKNLNPDTDYYFKVKAINGCSGGNFSNTYRSKVSSVIVDNIVKPLTEISENIEETVADKISAVPVVEEIVDKKIIIEKVETKSKPNIISYIVERGDSLWKIAKKFMVSASDIHLPSISLPNLELPEINLPKLDLTRLMAGMKLNIDLSKLSSEQIAEVAPEVAPTNGYNLDVKILAMNNEPLRGVKVTLHSTPRDAYTNEEGIASFQNVEPGEHKVYLAYGDYTGGGQSISLTGDNKNIEMVMQVNLNNNLSWSKILIILLIGSLIGGVIFYLLMKYQIIALIKRKKRKS